MKLFYKNNFDEKKKIGHAYYFDVPLMWYTYMCIYGGYI